MDKTRIQARAEIAIANARNEWQPDDVACLTDVALDSFNESFSGPRKERMAVCAAISAALAEHERNECERLRAERMERERETVTRYPAPRGVFHSGEAFTSRIQDIAYGSDRSTGRVQWVAFEESGAVVSVVDLYYPSADYPTRNAALWGARSIAQSYCRNARPNCQA